VFEGVWVSTGDGLPIQRLIARHRVEGVDVEMVQQHTWHADHIVVITATVSPEADDELVAMLDLCLSSAVSDSLPEFVDWQPPA
jgi:hypothetical protein